MNHPNPMHEDVDQVGHTIGHHMTHSEWLLAQILLGLPFVLWLIGYLVAVYLSTRQGKPWPFYRTLFWLTGNGCAVVTVAGPLAEQAHQDFTIHMVGHLLLGMLAPLLMALSAPMTLLLRTLPVTVARRLVCVMKLYPFRMLTDPLVASFLNIGGLWMLYTTDLFVFMHEHVWIHILVHKHVFLAGYLFTVAMIHIDPLPHRTSFLYRGSAFVLALAGHGILSKFIYAHPPQGVPSAQAETGGMLMYYGGDAIDVMIICLLCYQWYRATRPRWEMSTGGYVWKRE